MNNSSDHTSLIPVNTWRPTYTVLSRTLTPQARHRTAGYTGACVHEVERLTQWARAGPVNQVFRRPTVKQSRIYSRKEECGAYL